MSRTFHHSSSRNEAPSRTPRPERSRRDELAELLAELTDADVALNLRTWGAAPASTSRTTMLSALDVTLAERRAA